MSLLDAILLGILQGITEFLPVSSSGHLVIAQTFLGINSTKLLFSIVVHVATLGATLVVLRKQVQAILCSILKKNATKTTTDLQNTKTFYWIILTTLITGSLGFVLKDFFQDQFDSVTKVACCLLVTGVILFLPRWLKPKENKESFELGPKNSIFLGLAQTLAILPGISRSGTTIVSGLLLGLKRKDAGEMAFLISIPIILAALLLELLELGSVQGISLLPLTAGFISAFGSGWIALTYLLKWVRNGDLHYFAFYCWIVAGLLLIY